MSAGTPVTFPGIVGVQIDQAKLLAHVMRPQNVISAKSGPDLPAAPLPERLLHRPPLASLNVDNFISAVESQLANQCFGYCTQLRQNQAMVAGNNYNYATAPVDGGLPWTFDTPMHVASLSKTITAMAMTQLLNNLNVSYDTPISSYLPTYWTQGPNISLITFRNLMTHKSGLTSPEATDYESMKTAIASGTSGVGTYVYANMNYSLCRILLSVLNGNIPAGFTLPWPFSIGGLGLTLDWIWDFITISAFQSYVAANIFGPAQSSAHMVHQPGDALAYSFPAPSSETGWNDGDLTTTSGAAGWHMSVNQFLNVMGAFRHTSAIMSGAQAQAMLTDGFGVTTIQPTPAGTYYSKNGIWTFGQQAELGQLFFLPQGMEFVLLINSPYSGQFVLNVAGIVSTAYLNNLS
jgi:hypothetical protein